MGKDEVTSKVVEAMKNPSKDLPELPSGHNPVEVKKDSVNIPFHSTHHLQKDESNESAA